MRIRVAALLTRRWVALAAALVALAAVHPVAAQEALPAPVADAPADAVAQLPAAAAQEPAGDIQDAPGAQYPALLSQLPDYYYRPDYYNRPGLGARAIADYGPPGYQEREFQDAPGAPEYTPITPPPRLTPAEREKFVTRGMMPGSFLVPGTTTSFRLRGFVRLTGLYDFDPIGSRDDFVTNTIPVPQGVGQNENFAARYSRFALETWTPTCVHVMERPHVH